MNKLLYFLGFLFAAALQLKAMQIGTMTSVNHKAHMAVVDLSKKIGDHLDNHIDSFIDIISNKVVDKLENHIGKDGVSDKMMIMLENNADLFNPVHYKGHDVSLIQSMFFSKLKKKFADSKAIQKIKSLGSKVKGKLINLYQLHKEKLKHFFKVMLKAFVLPLFIKFVKKNIGKWRENTLAAIKKLKENIRKIALPIASRLYLHIEEKIDNLAIQNNIEIPEDEALKEIEQDERDIERLERQEADVINE